MNPEFIFLHRMACRPRDWTLCGQLRVRISVLDVPLQHPLCRFQMCAVNRDAPLERSLPNSTGLAVRWVEHLGLGRTTDRGEVGQGWAVGDGLG